MSLAVPVMPAVLCGAQVIKKIKMMFDPSDWQSDGPGEVYLLCGISTIAMIT